MKVYKFGGASVKDAAGVRNLLNIVTGESDLFIIVSAMGKTTNALEGVFEAMQRGEQELAMERIDASYAYHRGIIDDLMGADITIEQVDILFQQLRNTVRNTIYRSSDAELWYDTIVAFGELVSTTIISNYLNGHGVKNCWVDMRRAFLTEQRHKDANVNLEATAVRLKREIADKGVTVFVGQGFIGGAPDGTTTTLGREGSDYSAAIVANVLDAESMSVWKDVDGILTADPRIVPQARTVPEVTYEEAAELAYFGAQVLHPRSMVPCRKTGTPVRVKNSYNIESPGSIIVNEHLTEVGPVRAITTVKNVTLLDIVSTRMIGASGFMAHIFNQFLKWDISIDVIATSEVSISLTINNKGDLSGLLADMQGLATTECKRNKSIVTVICDADKATSILADGFAALVKKNINVQMISKGASKVNISMICDDSEADLVVQTLHQAFFPV